MNAPAADLTLEKIYSVLKDCYDPELPVSIVDLGLVYDVQIRDGRRVDVKMTLTTPGCSMGRLITEAVRSKILSLDGVEEAAVEIVWDPPWTHHMISEEGRKKLGIV